MKIDITKKYRTRDAKFSVTIVSTSGPYAGFPIVGYIHSPSNPQLCHWSEVGGYPANTNLDLIEVREPREWVIGCHSLLSAAVVKEGPIPDTIEIIRVREIID